MFNRTEIKICSIVGCERKVKSLNLCQLHYTRQWKTGNVGAVKPARMKGNLIFNFGVNDSSEPVASNVKGKQPWTCNFYMTWYGMLQRCYSAKYHIQRPRAAKGTVCKEWKSFQTFKTWMETQDWKNKELDKDILIPGNTHYSPETCCFIEQKLNNMFQQSHHTGISYSSARVKPYTAKITKEGKEQWLGAFRTKKEALAVRNKARACWIREVAKEQTDLRIQNGLLKHATELLHD